MGRGRAKAKQTKVARDLKYRTHQTDFSALAQELHSGPGGAPASTDNLDDTDDDPEGAGRAGGETDEADEADEADEKWSDYADPSAR